MDTKTQNTLKFGWWKILLPTLIGFGAIAYMFHKEFSLSDFEKINFSAKTIFWFFIALCFMIGRDAGFTIRYRYLTDKKLTWMQSIKVTLLAEFGSAVTPSTVGGSSMAVLFLNKEKISVGKSTSIVFVSVLLDEMFFVIAFPILMIFLPLEKLFGVGNVVTNSIVVLFIVAYCIKLLICVILIIGLFFHPQLIRSLIIRIFRLPFLRKWHKSAVKTGDDLMISAKEIKKKTFSFWWPPIVATILSWCSRYLVINALFMAFFHVDDNLLIFARQFVMWVVMIISPTPGGVGVAEYMFNEYLSDLIPFAFIGIGPVIVLIWRLLTYYNYLCIGAILVPRWVKSKF